MEVNIELFRRKGESMKLFIVLAKEYDSQNGVDHIVGAFEDEEMAQKIADELTAEWDKRKCDRWCYSFKVLTVDDINVQYIHSTKEVYPD